MKLTYQAIREILADVGPMTSADVAAFFPLSDHKDVSSMINRMRRAATKRVYIRGWTYDSSGTRRYPCAVYALGDKADATKPKPLTNAERCLRYRAKTGRAPGMVNSVWALGATL